VNPKREIKTVPKPWGEEKWLVVNEKYAFKVLKVNKGHTGFPFNFMKKKKSLGL